MTPRVCCGFSVTVCRNERQPIVCGDRDREQSLADGALRAARRLWTVETGAAIMEVDALTEIGSAEMIPDGLSFDIDNPKYRQFKQGEDILEYTLEGGEITVDWVSGTSAASMLKIILDADGAGVTRISGYVTDKLGRASNIVLERFGQRLAGQLGVGWKVTVEMIEGRKYLLFTR